MPSYYVNKNAHSTGEHEVHIFTCPHMPELENRIYLGVFKNCRGAIKEAKEHFLNVDGCYFCSKE